MLFCGYVPLAFRDFDEVLSMGPRRLLFLQIYVDDEILPSSGRCCAGLIFLRVRRIRAATDPASRGRGRRAPQNLSRTVDHPGGARPDESVLSEMDSR